MYFADQGKDQPYLVRPMDNRLQIANLNDVRCRVASVASFVPWRADPSLSLIVAYLVPRHPHGPGGVGQP